VQGELSLGKVYDTTDIAVGRLAVGGGLRLKQTLFAVVTFTNPIEQFSPGAELRLGLQGTNLMAGVSIPFNGVEAAQRGTALVLSASWPLRGE